MNRRGVRMLVDIYGIPERKIELIPHGIPDLPFDRSTYCKRKLGINGRRTILTFGLLSKNKGIEVMLRALPTIVKLDPSVLYVVLGATHPEVLHHEGQSYLCELKRIVKNLRLQKNVVFHNRFVSDEELFVFLGAADIYVTPYLHKQQLTSGTLAFAVGAGKAVVSTPYWAAEELLAQGRGRLVRFGDSEHIAQSVGELLSNDALFFRMRRLAYEYGRSITWSKVGRVYWNLLRSQASYAQMPLSADIGSLDWQTSTYGQQPIYQSA